MTAPAPHVTEWKAYIGPPARRDDDDAYWAWTGLSTGSAYDPETAIPATTLSAGIDLTGGLPEQISLTSATGWPSAGGCWVGANGTGQRWGYVEYSGLSGGTADIERFDKVSNEYTGIHSSGAAVRFWWPIAVDDGIFNLRETAEGNVNVRNWRATCQGWKFPLPALRIGHLFLLLRRSYDFGTPAWGSWVVGLVGWINSVKASDDADGEGRWDVEIVSSAGVYGIVQVDGVKVGASQITKSSTARGSSALAAAYKAYNLGEFEGATPTLSASNVLDGRTLPAYISERYIGQTNTPANPGETFDGIATGADVIISQIHVARYPGQGKGYRWIELTVLDDSDLGNVYVMYSKLASTAPNQYVIDCYFILDASGYEAGDRIIVAESAALFAAENPDHDAAEVIDGASLTYITGTAEQYILTCTGATSGVFRIRNTGSFIGGTDESTDISYNSSPSAVASAISNITPIGSRMHCYGSNLPGGPVYIVIGAPQVANLSGAIRPYDGAVELAIKAGYTIDVAPTLTKLADGNDAWSTGSSSGTVAAWFDIIDTARGVLSTRLDYNVTESTVRWGSDNVKPGLGDNDLWAGSVVDASGIPAPHTLRYIYDPSSPSEPADYWESSEIHHPGYEPNGKEWLLIQLAGMGLALASDASSGATSLSLKDESGAESVNGLPSTGTLQVGAEQIAYTTIDRSAGTVGGFTTTADHSEGDPVFVVVSGIATDALPITAVELKRKDGLPELEDFVLRWSPYALVRTPDDDGYADDYPNSVTVTAESGTNYSTATVGDLHVGTLDLSGSKPRVKWLLLEVTKMSTQPYRLALNEVAITYDTSVFETGDVLEGVTIGEVMTTLLDNAGFPSAGYTDNATTDVDGYTTERGLLWPILVDLADFGNKQLRVARDSKITIDDDVLWTPGSSDMDAELPSEDATLTRDNVRRHEFEWVNGRNVGQVELQWRSPDGESEGTARYPSTRAVFGAVERLGPYIYADATAATNAAKRRWYQLRRPHAALWEIAGNGQGYFPLFVYGGTWDWGDYGEMDRTLLCVGADHELSNGEWSTVIQTIQISREDDR